ncbi:hypothetical protein O1611_g1875 [Lasiodiplodia mahajangana]|uniref:Uncharacterized protein n=1 Tax=Lasiodiplodia mahajangana TaxID=1108764 RepID=A0ACC2JWG1_9PEZI|nr:hypothetical protein O1611_g1875 [Lasiodiplodia mahajangana]
MRGNMADRYFACPYYLRDHKSYSGCRKYELSRIRDVKQHLSRLHQRPPYCPRCYSTYDNEDARDDHIRTQQCEARAPVAIDGVSDDQQKILRRRANSKQTAEDQWYFVWDTLFPNTLRPDSVYLDKAFSDVMSLLRRYMVTHGVTVTLNCLQAHNAVPWASLGNSTDLAIFQHSIIQEVLEKLFEGMNDFMKGKETQQIVTSNPRPQTLLSSKATSTNDTESPQSRIQEDRRPSLGASSQGSFLGADSESQFDDIFHMLQSEPIAQGQHTEEYMHY